MQNNSLRKKTITLVTGPTDSGKSLFAEKLVGGITQVLYIATLNSSNLDTEMRIRVTQHQLRRNPDWDLLEASSNLYELVNAESSYKMILLDSLGSYVSANINMTNEQWQNEKSQLIMLLDNLTSGIIIVSEEVGWSVFPSTKIGNLFRSRLTKLNQQIALMCHESWLVVHNRAIDLNKYSTKV